MARKKAIHISQPKAATRAPPDVSLNAPNEPLVDFHIFAELAPELQDTIWEFACYSTPTIIPMFINNATFKFEFDKLPAVPALLHAAAGARAIGLRHFILLQAKKFDRTLPPPARPQNLSQQAHALLPVAPQAPLLHIQNQANGFNALIWQNTNSPHTQGTHQQGHALSRWITNNPWAMNPHGLLGPAPPFSAGMFPPFQLTLPAQVSQPQGPNLSMLHIPNFQPIHPTQNYSQNLGTTQPHTSPPPPVFGPGWLSLFQTTQQQTPAQQGHHVHFAHQQHSQHHAPQNSMFGRGLQPAQIQSSGHQNFAQHGSQHHTTTSVQNILGGGIQPTPAHPSGRQSSTQQGSQHRGGNFQSALADQSFTQSIPQFSGAMQSTAVQTLNQASSGLATVTSPVVQLLPSSLQRRFLPADGDSNEDSGRNFYVNHGSDFFRLQVGSPANYHYPVFNLAEFPQLPNSVSDQDRLEYLQELQRKYSAPSPFPADGKLPSFFANIQHLVLNLELPPCHSPLRSWKFRTWMRRSASSFCSVVIKSTIAQIPNLKNLDLLVARDTKRCEDDRMVLRHWRYAAIREENGITFGHAELGLLEMEIRLWMMSEYMGKDGPEGPEVRIVVHVPQQYSQTKW